MVKTVERKRLKFKDDYTYLGRNMIMDEHPEHIHKSLLEYFKKEDLHQYPDMWKPYEKLSNFLGVPQDELLITRGVEGAFKQVFETLVEEGDSVGILTPTCRMYHVYAEVYDVDVIEIEAEEPDYKISVDQVKEVVPDIKVLFLDNPKSHLPNHFTHQELDTIITYCNFMGVKVFLDEVYIGWGIDSYLPKLHEHKNLIVSSSFSKIAFASLRVGWLVANKDLKERIESSRESCELDYFACKSIEFIIDNQDYINELKKNILETKDRWYKELSKSFRFKVYDSKGYVLRLFTEDQSAIWGGSTEAYREEGLCKNVYNRLKDKKIIVEMVDPCNLVFSVTNNKKIEDIIFKTILIDSNELMDNEDGTLYIRDFEESQPKGGIFRRYWENGNLRYEWYYKKVEYQPEQNGKRADGISKGWYPNGNLKQTISRIDEKKDGLWTEWNEDGTILSEGTYRDDAENGLTTRWYGNGQKMVEETYKDSERDGLSIGWYENGQKNYEENYKDGELEGKSTDWYRNGQKQNDGTYKDGKQDGLFTTWFENGQKELEETYKNGNRDGLGKLWYENGQKILEGTFKDGKENGIFTSWNKNGQKCSEVTFKDGEYDGSYTSWNENGQKCE